jgi:hypothetical protein
VSISLNIRYKIKGFEMKQTIVAIILLSVSIVPLSGFAKYNLPCRSTLLEASLDSAISQNGVREASGRNDGKQVELYQNSVGIGKRAPYCAAGQYWAFAVSADALGLLRTEIPIKRTGMANDLFNHAKAIGRKTTARPARHDLIVWRHAGSSSGHIERIISAGRAGWVETIAFNTSSGAGQARDGEGVFIKRRNLYAPLGNMAVRGLIGFIPFSE